MPKYLLRPFTCEIGNAAIRNASICFYCLLTFIILRIKLLNNDKAKSWLWDEQYIQPMKIYFLSTNGVIMFVQ